MKIFVEFLKDSIQTGRWTGIRVLDNIAYGISRSFFGDVYYIINLNSTVTKPEVSLIFPGSCATTLVFEMLPGWE